jgi:hypothetical protein
MRRAWQRLLDGDRPWGSIDIRPDRFGVTRYRLVVYPPGINESQRRRLRIWRGSPLWGALLWIVAQIVLSQFLDPWTALALASIVYIVSGAVALACAADLRSQVRTLGVTFMAGYSDRIAVDARNKLEAVAASLLEADERLRQGQISAADHELAWWQAYNQLTPGRSPASGARRRSVT